MNQKLKIKFVDFWPGFIPEKSYFLDMLGGDEKIELSDNPEIIFFSNFGQAHKNYKCFRVFFSSENERPNMSKCDIALTFDYSKNKRHFRLPLFVLFAFRYGYNPHKFSVQYDKAEILEEWKKRKFCCIVVSNGLSKKRIDFFKFLNKKERVDSGGKYLNNIGAPVQSKIDFIRDYKFVISFENSSHSGYTTEKLLEPLLTYSIPIYWGDPKVKNDFNSNSFIDLSDFENYDKIYDLMKLIESNDSILESYLFNKPVNIESNFWDKNKVRSWILEKYKTNTKPIAQKKSNVFISIIIERIKIIKYWLEHYTIGHFR